MSNSTQATFKDGVRKAAGGALIASGVTLTGALIAGGLLPLFSAYAAGSLGLAAIREFATSIGGNALAGWLQQLGDKGVRDFLRNGEQQLAKEIDAQLANEQFSIDAEHLLAELDVLSVAMAALQGDSEQQLRFLARLADDVQRISRNQGKLHRRLVDQLSAQYDQLVADNSELMRSNAAFAEQLKALSDKLEQLRTYTISGNQNVAVIEHNNGPVNQGTHHHHYGTQPAKELDILEALFPQRGKIG